jgi:putative SOS response-associated peptidase YedK
MCYDIAFTVNIKELKEYFPELILDEQLSIDFSQAVHIMGHGYGEHPIIYRHRDDHALHMRLMEWGCIPFYVKDEQAFAKQRATMLNARSERVLEDKSSYWYKIRNRRCLIPVSAFYEHRSVKGFKNKIPYHISIKNEKAFFLPGLYSVTELPDKQTGEMVKRSTFTILTRAANPLMKQIHNDGTNKERMPLILPFEMADKWTAEELSEEDLREMMQFEFPYQEMEFYPVYTIRTTKERPDGKAKHEPYVWEGLEDIAI